MFLGWAGFGTCLGRFGSGILGFEEVARGSLALEDGKDEGWIAPCFSGLLSYLTNPPPYL